MKTNRSAITNLFTAGLMAVACSAFAAEPQFITHPPSTPIAATVQLLRTDGNVGRDTPFFANYRPQVWLSGEKEGVTCAVKLPLLKEKVEPGETAEVTLECLAPVRVRAGQPQFKATLNKPLISTLRRADALLA